MCTQASSRLSDSAVRRKVREREKNKNDERERESLNPYPTPRRFFLLTSPLRRPHDLKAWNRLPAILKRERLDNDHYLAKPFSTIVN